MEFASFFNSLGVEVTVIEMLDEILGGMDKELSAMLRAEYAKRGIKFMLDTKVVALSEVASGNGDTQQIQVNYENAEGAGCVIAERLLMSVGRRPVTKGFGLENLNLDKTARGNIQVDGQMQTSVPGVYVCGDLTGFSLLAHTAVREAEVAVHAVLGKKDCMSYRAIPGVVYTNPEIAGVGDTEEALQRKGIPYRAVKLPMLIPVALSRRMRALTVCASCCWRKMIPFWEHMCWAIRLRRLSRWPVWLSNSN